MNKKASVTFIICTYNRADYLDKALDSLLSERACNNFSFELLVVDNNSSDRTPEVVQQYQDSFNKNCNPLRYVKETKQGLTHARNQGIREATTPYIVFLDDDVRATKSLIPAWISFFENHPDIVAAGGKIHVRFDDTRPNWMSHFLLPLVGRHDLGNTIKKYPAHRFPFGGNMGFKKSVFDQVGYFDTDLGKRGEKLYAKGEEKELFDRVRSITSDIYYIPDAFLYHHVDGSRLTTQYVKNQAIALGQGMKLRLETATTKQFFANWFREITKVLGSVLLGIFYFLGLNFPKAKMLFKFRWWIWKGYFEGNSNDH